LRKFVSVYISAAIAVFGGQAAMALDLTFEGISSLTREDSAAFASQNLPIGPHAAGRLEYETIDAPLARSAFRIDTGGGLNTYGMITSLRDQVTASGFDIAYECADDQCGGFDFRYALDLLPEPDMHVDLGDFRYLLAQRGGGDAQETVALVVSRSSKYGFVHVTRMGTFALPDPKLTGSTKSPLAAQPDLITALSRGQAVVLPDVGFASGKADLVLADTPHLSALGQWLQAQPDRAITLVGHTDASGNAAGNLALSQARAFAVRDRLVGQFGIDATRIFTLGRGGDVPLADNATPQGRAQNRRIEVVLR
jgi:OOP family OmpA-OmpF porin